MIGITENWLKNSITDNELFSDYLSIYKSDRQFSFNNSLRILIVVKEGKYDFCKVNLDLQVETDLGAMDIVTIKVLFVKTITIARLFIPSAGSIKICECTFEFISTKSSSINSSIQIVV